jgi:hypothetical protein
LADAAKRLSEDRTARRLAAQLHSAVRLKITDVRIVNLKVVRETGKIEMAWNPGTITTQRIGGGSPEDSSARISSTDFSTSSSV